MNPSPQQGSTSLSSSHSPALPSPPPPPPSYLWDVVPPLLHHRVEPGQHKQQLRAQRPPRRHKLGAPPLVGALHVLLQPGGRLEGHLQAALQQGLGELGVALRGEEEAEAGVLLRTGEVRGEGGGKGSG